MIKLEELEKKLKKHQKRYQHLQKYDKGPSGRYGHEFRDLQMRVLESMIVDTRQEITRLKRKRK